MTDKLQKKTKALWTEMFAYLQEPRTANDVRERFCLSRQLVYAHLENMKKAGFPLNRRRTRIDGCRALQRWLGIPLLDALVKLNSGEVIAPLEPTKEKPKKAEHLKVIARDVSEESRGSAPPWFVLTTQCQAMYSRQEAIR